VFEPFFTTKPAGKGSGLGLAMVRAFVRQADGHIRIDSESGRGTLVRLYLPRAETVVPARDAAPAAPPVAPAATPARILVVEDDADVLQVTLAMLRALGHEVLAAPSGDAALGLIEGRADIDLMLCDVMLAGALNGPDLARRASAMRPGLAILFVSGYAESGVIDRDIIGAGYDLLPKPFRRADLRLRIDAILAARRSPR
jgi:CheY-like chemotaxis protein